MAKISIKQIKQPTSDQLDSFLSLTGIGTDQIRALSQYYSDELAADFTPQSIANATHAPVIEMPIPNVIYEFLLPIASVTLAKGISRGRFEILFVASEENIEIHLPESYTVYVSGSNLNQAGTNTLTQGKSYSLSFRFFGNYCFVTVSSLYTVD